MKNFFKFLFKKEKGLVHIKYSVLGIKFRRKNKIIKRKATVGDVRAHSLAAQLHKNLEKYRGIYSGRDIVIVGGGATVGKYKPIKNAIHIGINRSYQLKDINFDYLFAQDNFPNKNDTLEFINYKPETCVKFLGLHTIRTCLRMRPATIAQTKNREFYVLNCEKPFDTPFPIDISVEPFAYFSGTVFAALQFALFTNPKRIYLVGFDCNVNHHFEKKPKAMDLTVQFESWQQFKIFKDMYWEDIEIVSINPVNLKGFFTDIYTKD